MAKPENDDELTAAQKALDALVGGGDDSAEDKQPEDKDAKQDTSDDANAAAANEPPQKTQEPQQGGQSDNAPASPEEEAALGDKGKRALDRMKDALQKSSHTIADLTSQIGQLKSEIAASKIQQAASGRLAHPELALKLLDTSELDASDQKAVGAAIDGLLKQYPDLGVRQDDDNGLDALFGSAQHPSDPDSRTKSNAAVFGAQLDALGF